MRTSQKKLALQLKYNLKLIFVEVYLEPCQTSRMENVAKIVSNFQPLTILESFKFQFRCLTGV